MKSNISTGIIAAAAFLTLAGCQKDDPFLFNAGEGVLRCETLTVDYVNSNNPSRATGVNIADFDVNFIRTSGEHAGDTVRSFKYYQMPEVVSLPKGDYRVGASYGDNPVAEWESPFYLGNSNFSIEANKITEDVETVICKLSNIRVSVNLDDMGLDILGDDAKVVVEAGSEGSLTFDKTTTNKSGYFRYVNDSHSIVATFSGTVNDNYVEGVSRTYDDVNAGNHYALNFAVTTPDNAEPGDIVINGNVIRIDTTVTVINDTIPLDPNEPEPDWLVDNMRPTEEPDEPAGPVEPVPPVITPHGFALDTPYAVGAGDECVFDVKSVSAAGFTEFTVDIESDKLTPEELSNVGLASHLDLVNPGDLAGPLQGLGFPINVGGMKEVEFSITGFIPLLGALGSGEHHKFKIKVSDEYGTTEGTVHLVSK